jgi:DNA-binding GntR family transcriptional regulator
MPGGSAFGGAYEWTRVDNNGGLAARIADQLAEAIVLGELKGGTVLVEPEIAKTFGVSRTSVREALYMLEHDELVERPPRRSARVVVATEKQAIDIYICRAYIYGLSARMCVPNLTDDDVAKLDDMVLSMESAVEAGDARAYYGLNLQFHDYIGRASGNEMLLKLMVGMGKRTLRFRYMSLTIPAFMQASVGRHKALMERFHDGDAVGAQHAVHLIVSAAGDAVLKHFFDNPSRAVSAEVLKW